MAIDMKQMFFILSLCLALASKAQYIPDFDKEKKLPACMAARGEIETNLTTETETMPGKELSKKQAKELKKKLKKEQRLRKKQMKKEMRLRKKMEKQERKAKKNK